MAGNENGRQGWIVAFGSALALVVGQGSVNVFATGVFLKPVAQDLGLGRGTLASAIGVSSLVTALATPFFGQLVDSYGVRRPLLASILLFAAATAAMSLLSASPLVVFSLFALGGLCSVGQNPTAYSKVVTRWFDRQRGFALGITLAGVGVGTAVLPAASEFLVRVVGWRGGYLALAFAILVLAFLPVSLVVREPGAADGPGAPGAPAAGASLAQAARQWRYWAMVAAFCLAGLVINGMLVHVVPMLTDRGIPPALAVTAMTGAGLALIVGRLFAGWLMDRVFAPLVGVFFLLCPLAGLLVLGSGAGYPWPLVGTVLLGLGIGAEIDLMSLLISRYFGARAFGALHGTMFAFVMLGQAAGAGALGWVFQLSNSYDPAFAGLEALLIVASALLLVLGPYPYPPAGRHAGVGPGAARAGLGSQGWGA